MTVIDNELLTDTAEPGIEPAAVEQSEPPQPVTIAERMEARAAEAIARTAAEKETAEREYGEIVRNPFTADEERTGQVLGILGLTPGDLKADIAAVTTIEDLESSLIDEDRIKTITEPMREELTDLMHAHAIVLFDFIRNMNDPEHFIRGAMANYFQPDKMDLYGKLLIQLDEAKSRLGSCCGKIEMVEGRNAKLKQKMDAVRAKHPRVFQISQPDLW